MSRLASLSRTTRETRIEIALDLDGSGRARISTGLGFLDHLLEALTVHASLDLELACEGDLQVDDHHTVEDCALVLGAALAEALRAGGAIRRFGSACAPLDEALVRAVVDVSGRPFARVDLDFRRPTIGEVATENLRHFLASLATAAGWTVHVDQLAGDNDHHKAEAAFKALALALRQAVALADGGATPSTKGSIEGLSR